MHAEPNALPEEEEPAVTPGDDSNDDPTPPLPVDPSGTPERNPAVDQAANDSRRALPAEEQEPEEPAIDNERDMPSDPNVPPPEPVQPMATPPNPGQVQPTPQPM